MMEDVPDFEMIVQGYAAMVQGALKQLGVESSALDDASQEVFLVLFRRFSDYDPARSLASWLWGIARGVASTHRRSNRRRARLLGAALLEGTSPNVVTQPDDAAELHEARRMLDTFLGGLDEDKCAVFVLAEIEGRSGPEIAAMLDVNVNTVYARLRAARRRFEHAIEGHRRGLARHASAWFGLRWALPTKVATASLSTAMTAALIIPAWPSDSSAPASAAADIAATENEFAEPTTTNAATRSRAGALAAKVQSTTEDTFMRTPKLLPSLAVVATLAAPTVAAAAPNKGTQAPVKTDQDADDAALVSNGEVSREYIFEGDSLEGEVLSPGGIDVQSRAGIRHQSLITIRGHFLRELISLGRDV